MTEPRNFGDFEALWQRPTVFSDPSGTEFHLLSVPDLVRAKKTQRSKDWPVIEALVGIHFEENQSNPMPEWISCWLTEAGSAELLLDLGARFPSEAAAMATAHPLLAFAVSPGLPRLREALDAEVRAEQEKDRIYWEPFKREM
jgi:hypothetical protein